MNLPTIDYHSSVRSHFKKQDKTWKFFAESTTKENQLQQFKTDLLKNTYKFDEATDTHIYDKVKQAKEKLGLDLNVIVYQAEYSNELNASIVYLNQEAHIVLSGGITKLLDETELLAVIAHELSHVKLFMIEFGELEIADRIITSIANDYRCDAAYYETARVFRLYTEIYCDRGALLVTDDANAVIRALVKIATGLEKVSAESYLKQADEIFAKGDFTSEQLSHPENFIRAKALQLWMNDKENANEQLSKMIEHNAHLNKLDIFKQDSLTALTKNILYLILKPKWFQTDIISSLSQQYFKNLKIDKSYILNEKLQNEVKDLHDSIKDYLSYVLLDFSYADTSLEQVPLGYMAQLADDLDIISNLKKALKKEFKYSDKKVDQLLKKAISDYRDIQEGDDEQIYE